MFEHGPYVEDWVLLDDSELHSQEKRPAGAFSSRESFIGFGRVREDPRDFIRPGESYDSPVYSRTLREPSARLIDWNDDFEVLRQPGARQHVEPRLLLSPVQEFTRRCRSLHRRRQYTQFPSQYLPITELPPSEPQQAQRGIPYTMDREARASRR
jgi:hypothetical protein